MMSHRRQRILVFGGTFDPPHRAHVELPPLVARKLNCDRIFYVPASISPHKLDTPPTNAVHRVNMLRLALAAQPLAEVCEIELKRPGPSYTVETLRVLSEHHGSGTALLLLIGSDQALSFHRWHEWKSILRLVEVVVMLRPPHDRDDFQRGMAHHWPAPAVDEWMDRIIDLPQLDLSARAARAGGTDAFDDVPEAVRGYIREQRLYGQDA